MGSTFIASRCAHIDTIGSNVLIRGNMPLIGDNLHYAYNEIKQASGIDLDSYDFVEIPIIDNVGERAQFSQIVKSFGVDPDTDFPESLWPWWEDSNYSYNNLHGSGILKTEGIERGGMFLWRPFEGLPANTDPSLFLNYPGWDYSGFINNLIMMTKSYKDTAFYFHCQLGADRTGAAHIGYLMKAKKMSLEKASEVANNSTSAGAPNIDYQRLVEAYSKTL